MGLLRRRGNGGKDVGDFLPIVAPDDFIRYTDYQYFGCTVDLYSTFEIYKSAVSGFAGRWIAEIYDNQNFSFSTAINTWWVYGEVINGTPQVSAPMQSGTNVFTAGSTERWILYYNSGDSGVINLLPSVRWVYIGNLIREFAVTGAVETNNRGLIAVFTYTYIPVILQTRCLSYNSDSGFTHILNGTFHVKGGLGFNNQTVRKLLGITRVECDSIGFKDISTGVIGATTVQNCINMSGEIVIAPTVTSIGIDSFFNCPLITSVKMQGNAPTLGNANSFNLQTPAPIPLKIPIGATGYDVAPWNNTARFTIQTY
jgi:hypothetical protein